MIIKSILVILILGTASLSSAKDVAAKHKKSFASLNKRLEKEVNSDDPVLNRAALKKLLDDKSNSCKLLASSYMDTLKKLIEFTELEDDPANSRVIKDTELAQELDSGLADESRVKTPNYPLTRIDKIIQHYAFINAKYNQFKKQVPVMKFGFKQLAYDQINSMLIDALPENDDIETNVSKAEEILKALEPKDGALADALKQLLQLKLTLNEDTCNEKGHDILHKNSMSTRLSFYSYYVPNELFRRVDKIYVHYYKKHEQLCRPVMAEVFKSRVKDLNPNTYRKVLGMASARFLEPWKYSKIVEELNEKEIDGNFFTSTVAQRVEEKLKSYRDDDATFDLLYVYLGEFDSSELIEYLKYIGHGDPESKFLELQIDERAGRKYVDEGKVKHILNEYLFEPCKDYQKSMGEIIRADLFDANVNNRHKSSPKDKAMTELTYHFVHYAFQSCKVLLRDKSIIFEGIKKFLLPLRWVR